jgi:hypothetical protein
MRMAMWVGLVLVASFMWGRSNPAATSNQAQDTNNDHGQVTVRGCVGIENGDYVLTKQDPANTYQLQKAEKVKLKKYLGQRVEITGKTTETIPSSEDEINGRAGSASPVTIMVKSIRTISKQCESR